MEEEIDLKEIIKFFWSKKIIIAIVLILFCVLSLIYTNFIVTPLYSATTSLILVKMEFEDEADVAAYSKLIDRYTVVASSRKIIEKVKENLKLEISIDELDKAVWVSSNPTGYIIKITAEIDDSKKATIIANETAKVFMEEISKIYNDNNIKILDSAIENAKPININMYKNIIIFCGIGMICICAYYLCIYCFKDNVKNIENKN